jgi:hypothetical protein
MRSPKPMLFREGRGRRRKIRLVKPSPRKNILTKDLLVLVRNEVVALRDRGHGCCTKEEIAYKLNAKESQVAACLMELNIEGLVDRPSHRAPHDTNRDPVFGFPNWPGWMCDRYKIREKK